MNVAQNHPELKLYFEGRLHDHRWTKLKCVM